MVLAFFGHKSWRIALTSSHEKYKPSGSVFSQLGVLLCHMQKHIKCMSLLCKKDAGHKGAYRLTDN